MPAPLRDLKACLCWRYEQHEGEPKPRKVPYWANGRRRKGVQGNPIDRAALVTLEEAKAAAIRLGMDGVGIAMLGWGYTALDFDDCFNADGSLPEDIRRMVHRTYAEKSPSGKGVRAFVEGRLGNHRSKPTETLYGFETMDTKGFVTVTGDILPECDLLGYEDTVAPADDFTREFVALRAGGAERGPVDMSDPFLGMKPTLGLTVEEIEDYVRHLDPCMGRDEWIRVGAAIHHETEGDDTGFEIFDEWSSEAGEPQYPGTEILRGDWESFNRRAGSAMPQVTMATVIKMVNELSVDEVLARMPMLPEGEPGETMATPEGFEGKFPMRSVAEVSSQPPLEWFIKTLMPRAHLGMSFGTSTSGKTFLALDMAAAIARGVPWHGFKVKQARVLYVVAEGAGSFGKRLKAYCVDKGISLEELGQNLGIITDAPNLTNADDVVELIKTIKAAGGADLIILDTLAQISAGADENSGQDMGAVLGNLRTIQRQTGACLLPIHHPGKDLSKGARGWSGIFAALDYQTEVSHREDGLRRVRVTKMKDGDVLFDFFFRLRVVHLGIDEDGDPITSCVIEPAEAPPPPKMIIEKTVRRSPMQHHVMEIAAGVEEASIGFDELVTLCAAAITTPDGRDTRRQDITRAIHTLAKEREGPFAVAGGRVIFYS